MATIAGTIGNVSILAREKNPAGGARALYRLAVNFAAYTGSADDAAVNAIPTAVQNTQKNGLTFTLRGAATLYPGYDGSQAVYFSGASVSAATISGANATGNLTNAAGTELTSSVATTVPVTIIAWGDEAQS